MKLPIFQLIPLVAFLAELEEAVREDTILVSIMYVNNEIGAVEPVEEIARRIKNKNPKPIFMWMQFRHTANFRYALKSRGLICCR